MAPKVVKGINTLSLLVGTDAKFQFEGLLKLWPKSVLLPVTVPEPVQINVA